MEFCGTIESLVEKDLINLNGSLNGSYVKPSLTGSYLIDNELHKIIDYLIRDYVDGWYKSDISSKEEFTKILRAKIYNAIHYFNSRWIDFFIILINLN